MSEIKPVFWVSAVGNITKRRPPRSCNPIAYYPQSTIDRLTAELNSAREQLAERSEQYRWLQRMHEDECTARRVWADACRQAEAERDAADAERDAAVEAFTRLLTERQS